MSLIDRARQFSRRAIRTFSRPSIPPRAIVLAYHRVADAGLDPQLLAVSPGNFRDQMKVLREKSLPISGADLQGCVSSGAKNSRFSVVTFDDGYADNLHFAKPVLEDFDIPAAVFACSAMSDEQRLYWWDVLEYVILRSEGDLYIDLSSTVIQRKWHLSGDGRKPIDWSVLSPTDPFPRHRVYRELMTLLKPLSPAVLRDILEELVRQTGFEAKGSGIATAMTAAELRSLSEGGIVQVGAHTRDHGRLSSMERPEQVAQIDGCRRDLEKMLGKAVSEFSYPYGAGDDYLPETLEIVRKSGFARAYANIPGLVTEAVSSFEIPRILVRNTGPDEFAAQLDMLFG